MYAKTKIWELLPTQNGVIVNDGGASSMSKQAVNSGKLSYTQLVTNPSRCGLVVFQGSRDCEIAGWRFDRWTLDKSRAKGLDSLELTWRQRSMMQDSGATRIDEVECE